jgi:formate dehydrogenase beta subunit
MNEKNMSLIVDGKKISANKGQSILEAVLEAGEYIPHLCHHPDLPSFKEVAPVSVCYRGHKEHPSNDKREDFQGCGLCLVKLSDREDPVLSCITAAEDGMEIQTSSPDLEILRRENLGSILTHHPHACLTCAQKEGCSLTQCSTNVPEDERCCPQFDYCELRKVAEYIGIKEDISRYKPQHLYMEKDGPLFIRDYNLCIGCLRCVRACEKVIGAKSLGYVKTDEGFLVGTTRPSLEESGCRFCGACVEVCPTGALRDKELKPGDRRAALIPCTANCPVGMDIPSYIRCIEQGEYDTAVNIIKENIPLAGTLGYICPHPCENECRRGELNQPIAICDLKRFALQRGAFEMKNHRGEKTGKRIAVIGSGPAGLVAAYFLAKSGHAVTVYEEQEELGGMLRYAIPEYRLPRETVQQDIEEVKAMGVEFKTKTPVDSESFIKELNLDRWDAIFLATGSQKSKKIDAEGILFDGVYWGGEFLRDVREGKIKEMRGKAVVVGGGNVALDVAMTALRLGAAKVDVVCLEKKKEMPAFPWEIRESEEEGIVIHPGWGPHKIEGNKDRVMGIELKQCLSVFDDKGHFCPEYDTSKRKYLKADTVIVAIGQEADFSFLPPGKGIRTTEAKTIAVNQKTLETHIPGIFAGGEAVLGPTTAVEAMATGRKAAANIDKFLGGAGDVGSPTAYREKVKNGLWMGSAENFYTKDNVPMPCLPPEKRSRSFALFRLGYSEDDARKEASRCLRCDLRFHISPVVLPPEKWLGFNAENVSQVPDLEGTFQLLDEEKNIIYISGTPHLRDSLQEQLSSNPDARYFTWEEAPMYTQRESELLQQFLQKHGHLPSGNEETDDLF